jgi:hypothetical protein
MNGFKRTLEAMSMLRAMLKKQQREQEKLESRNPLRAESSRRWYDIPSPEGAPCKRNVAISQRGVSTYFGGSTEQLRAREVAFLPETRRHPPEHVGFKSNNLGGDITACTYEQGMELGWE